MLQGPPGRIPGRVLEQARMDAGNATACRCAQELQLSHDVLHAAAPRELLWCRDDVPPGGAVQREYLGRRATDSVGS